MEKKLILQVFELLVDTVITRHFELPTQIFKITGNKPTF